MTKVLKYKLHKYSMWVTPLNVRCTMVCIKPHYYCDKFPWLLGCDVKLYLLVTKFWCRTLIATIMELWCHTPHSMFDGFHDYQAVTSKHEELF